MSNDVTINVKANDAATSTLGTITKSSQTMATTVGSGVSKISSLIGGELGEVLAKAGDAFTTMGEKSEGGFSRITLGAAGLTGAGLALQAFASGSQRADAQLSAAIADTGASIDDFEGSIAKADDSMAKFGHDDDDTANALRILTTATGDTQVALNDLGVVADLAAAKHISLAAAAQQIALIYAGNTRALKQYGISMTVTAGNTDEANAAISALSAKINGQADASVDNFSGKVDEVKTRVEDWAETMSGKLGPALTIAGGAASIVSGTLDLLNARHAKQAVTSTAAATGEVELGVAETGAGAAAGKAAVSTDVLSVSETRLATASKGAAGAGGLGGLAGTMGMMGGYAIALAAGFELDTVAEKKLTDVTKGHGEAVDQTIGFVEGLSFGMVDYTKSAWNWVTGGGKAKDTTQALADATAGSITENDAYTTSINNAAKGTDAAGSALSRYTDALNKLSNPSKDLAQAEDDLKDSLAGLAPTVAQNGKTLDDNTVAGRANEKALRGIIDAYTTTAQKQLAAGESTDQVNSSLNDNEGKLKAAAVAAGLNSDAVQKIIDTEGKIQPLVTTQISVDTTDAFNKLDTLEAKIGYIVALAAQGDSTDASKLSASLPSQYNSGAGSSRGFAHGGIPGAATGGNRNGVIKWAEEGQEMAKLPNGSYVMSGPDTQSALAGAGGQQTVIVQLEVVGSGDLTDLIRKSVRVKGGGNVQVAFGTSGS